ncbi:MAG: hypothetical protein K8S27_05630 [Candidatus Omnitrophica bacterium]|nr:hypothetical protein [Candidatus Omnitrophota bacterium]
MKRGLWISLVCLTVFIGFSINANAQNDPKGFKKRIANKDITHVAVDWMGREETEGRLYKRIFESSKEADCNSVKFALEYIEPIDTSLMAKVTRLGLASHGSIYLTYEDGKKEQIDIGCEYGYFVGGSRMVSSAFRSWLLTKWLMRLIDQCQDCGGLNFYSGCFAPMAGPDPMGDVIKLEVELDNKTVVKGADIQAKLKFTNIGKMPIYFYGYCGTNVWFKIDDQWGRSRFREIIDRTIESKMPQEQDFITLKKGEAFTCNKPIKGRSLMSSIPRYYGKYLLTAYYENIASCENYNQNLLLTGDFLSTVHFVQSQPIEINLVRNWDEFQKQFRQMPRSGDREMVGRYLGPPDNKPTPFKDERGQPISEAFLKLDEWIYEQPFADNSGSRSRVIIRFQNDRAVEIKEEIIK